MLDQNSGEYAPRQVSEVGGEKGNPRKSADGCKGETTDFA